MSKLYEALLKAEREGKLRRDWAERSEAPAATDSQEKVSADDSTRERDMAVETAPTGEPAAPVRESAPELPDTGSVENGPGSDSAGTDSPVRSASEQENFAAKSNEGPHAARPAEMQNGASADSSVRTEEAEQRPILAPISDDFREREGIPPLVRSGREAAVAAEQFQVLRTFVQDWVAEHSKRILMITSALRQEGKSFTAINLATSLATPDTPVVLVDADCRAPSVHRAFNLTPLAGLTAYLSGRATLDECLHDTHIEGLRVLPAGNATVGNPEAFAGTRMRRLIEELRALSPAPYVLFDAPATLAAPETRILSRHMDAGLLVVAANMTPRKLVEQTLDLLKPMPFCGVVLNRFVLPYSVASKTDYRYGYGYPGADVNGNNNGNSGRRGRFGLHGLFGN